MRSGRLAAPTSHPRGASLVFHQPMVDREKVLAVLHKRFPGATADQVAAAANAIVGLEDEWEDVTAHEPEFGYHFSVQCNEICYLAEQAQRAGQFRVFRRRPAD
jgi:hypothetical protein